MIRRKCLRTRSIKMLVLDEADEMLNKGFKEQIYDVYRYLPPSTQVINYTAKRCNGFLVSFVNCMVLFFTSNRLFLFLQLCLMKFWKWPASLCQIPFEFWSSVMNWHWKESSSSLSQLKEKSGNLTRCVICMILSPSPKLSFFATLNAR